MSNENIPKLAIKSIGHFSINGMPSGWGFEDAQHIPNSVGVYWDDIPGERLFGGYSIIELIEIREQAYK